MPSSLKIKDVVVGTGELAARGKEVLVHYRGFLNRGEECCSTYANNRPALIDLDRRECIAGLRMGIEGMRAGGKRELIVSPHLAYGQEGVPGGVPPNAVMHFTVELVEVREKGERKPEDFPPGKQYVTFHPGEAKRNLARWQVNLTAEGICGGWITFPLPDGKWRRAPLKPVELKLNSEEIAQIKEDLQSMPAQFPKDCLNHDELWADHSEQANAITRDLSSNTLCLTVTAWERGQYVQNYSLREDNPVLLKAEWYRLLMRELKPHLRKLSVSA
jgi:hypothetical protein